MVCEGLSLGLDDVTSIACILNILPSYCSITGQTVECACLCVSSVFAVKTRNTPQSVKDTVAQTGLLLHSGFMLWNSKRSYLNVHLPTILTSVLAEKRLVARFHSNMLMLPRHESIFLCNVI